MNKTLSLCAPLLVCVATLLPVSSAQALDCEWVAQSLRPRTGTVPASIPTILWTGTPNAQQSADPTSIVTFTRKDPNGTSSAVPFRIEAQNMPGVRGTRLVPIQPLVAGITYRIVADPLDGENLDPNKDFDVAEFTTTAAVPLPTQTELGTLRFSDSLKHEELSVIDGGGGVLDFPAVYQDLAIDLSPELAPWGAALVYETLVDGKRWTEPGPGCRARLGSSWHGHGVDRVFASCGGEETSKYLSSGVTLGEHTIQFRARLAGSSLEFRSNVVTVNFNCKSEPSDSTSTSSTGGGSNTSSVGAGATAGPDTTNQKPGVSTGVSPTTSAGSGTGNPSASGRSNPRCSIRSGAGERAWMGSMACLVLIGWVGGRRRRARAKVVA